MIPKAAAFSYFLAACFSNCRAFSAETKRSITSCIFSPDNAAISFRSARALFETFMVTKSLICLYISYTFYTFTIITITTVKILNNMNTTLRVKTADKVKHAIERGWKKGAIAEHLGISAPTFRSRLKDNCWQFSEIQALKTLGII